jgi:hypothetical protein
MWNQPLKVRTLDSFKPPDLNHSPDFDSNRTASFTTRGVHRLQPRFPRTNYFPLRERAGRLQLLVHRGIAGNDTRERRGVLCIYIGVQGDHMAGRILAALDTRSFLFKTNRIVCTEPIA